MQVLSSGKVKTGSWRYYTNSVACRATDYYLGIGEAPGRWTGPGLQALGLEPGSRVTEQQLEALFGRALHPTTSERLGRAWRTDGVTGFDLTFSAPKSVSSLWALGKEQVAAAALAAHQQAVTAGLAYLQCHASWSRRGTNGVEQIATAGLTAALFDHRTSREGDPQLHTHALVVNKALCTDGVWRTLDGREMFDHKKTAGMIYQSALRNELQTRLGVEFGPVSQDGQADIVGVPKELLKLWSKRTTAIEAEAGPKIAEYENLLGRSLTATERVRLTKTAVLKTRPGKTHTELATLKQSWTDEAASVGWTAARLLRAARVTLTGRKRNGSRQDRTDGLARDLCGVLPARSGQDRSGGDLAENEDLASQALLAAGRRAAVFSRSDLAGQVAAHLPATGLTAAETVVRVEQLTDRALALAEAVPVGHPARDLTPRASDRRYATLEVLQAENRILSLARRGAGRGYGAVDPQQLLDVPQQAAPSEGSQPAATRTLGLDPGQLRAVQHLTGDGDFLTVMTAPAGAGKTSTLGVASRAWQAGGYRVVGLAPSARAAAELAEATGRRTDTLAKWLHNHAHPDRISATERAWTALDDRTVVIVDEASMASTLDLDRLTAAAGKAAAKVVLVGDPSQIGVINGPGGMLAALSHAGHGVTLEQIHRFTQPWERAASLQLRQGHAPCLATYREHDRLHPCPDSDTGLQGVFSHWTQARSEGLDALMLARTRLDVDALNTLARHAAIQAGEVSGPITGSGGRDWQPGDLLRTRRNDRTLVLNAGLPDTRAGHVRNGDRYRVLGPGPADGLIVESLTGRGRVNLPAPYLEQHCEYGWATTIDSAQGATADVGIVLVRPGLDREHLYVAMTRGRHGNHAYITTDPAHAHDHGPAARPRADRASQPSGQEPPTRPAAAGQDTTDTAHVAEPTAAGRSRRGEQPPAGYHQDPLPFEQETVAVPEPSLPQPPAHPTAEQQEQAARVLWKALRESGGQDAAHTALDAARRAARDLTDTTARQVKERARRERETPLPVPAEHQQTLTRIEQLRAEQQALRARQRELWTSSRTLQSDLDTAPRWTRGRRRDLTSALGSQKQELSELQTRLLHNENGLDDATALAARQAREQRAAEAASARPPLVDTLAALRPVVDLADPRPAPGSRAAQAAARRARQPTLDPRRGTRSPGWQPHPDPPHPDPPRRDGRGLSR